jgi:ATPase family associated with various cellular activities (AAA)
MSILNSLMGANQRVLLVGPPGCGKTARIAALAKDHQRKLVVMRASLSERVDFGGALVPDMQNGVTRALPLEVLSDLQSTTEPTLLFLDDLGQAPIDVQAALMRLFDEGALSPDVLIWGATNRPGDVAGVTRLCEPLRSRFHLAFAIAAPGTTDSPNGPVVLGTWADEVAQWCDWAMDNNAPAEVIAWHRSTTGRTLYDWKPSADPALRMPDFRSWETVIRLWDSGIRDLSTLSAAVGKPAASEFLAFAKLAHKLPSPDQVWMDPKGAPVPDDPSALYLVASMLAGAVEPKHATAVVTYLSRMPRVYGALLARDAYRKLGAKLSGSKEWVSWFTKNQEIFAVN